MNAEAQATVSFQVANRAATHLGRKLYSTTPPALAELIANSYDAYARRCYVVLDNGQNHIVVADDGVGMDIAALNDRYAMVGREKEPEPAPEGFSPRDPMGRKGIGKLASFSLGDEYEVYTRTSPEDKWTHFRVLYSDFVTSDLKYDVEADECELPEYLSDFADFEHGFISVIRGLRRDRNKNTIESLKTQLSRRFYIKSASDGFELLLNGAPLDLSRNAYYGNLEHVTYVGFTREEISDLLGNDEKAELEELDASSAREGMAASVADLVDERGLRGWVGTVEKPKQLSAGGNSANIIVYINKKIADEDVLRDRPNATMAGQYIVGEFMADYLGSESEDPITSSRQGLDHSDLEVARLVDLIAGMRSVVIAKWDSSRATGAIDRLPAWASENESYRKWMDGLNPTQRKLHNGLLKTLSVKMDQEAQDDSETKALLNSFISVVESNAIFEMADTILDYAGKSQEELLVSVAGLLGKVSASEDLKQAAIVQERLKAIQTLEELMDDPSTVEKAFENHLAKNPWLINPYWNQSPRTQEEVKVVTQEFNRLYQGKDGDYRKTFIDICIYIAEEPYPIIVELKRNALTPYSRVSFNRIKDQVSDYRKAVIQGLPLGSSRPPQKKEIPAYFICPEDTGYAGEEHGIVLEEDEPELLKALNITLLSYRDLVANAKKAYRDHIRVVEEEGGLPYFEA